jgi:hypothetical protein
VASNPDRSPLMLFPGGPHLAMVADGREEIAGSMDSWLHGVLDSAEPVAAEVPA